MKKPAHEKSAIPAEKLHEADLNLELLKEELVVSRRHVAGERVRVNTTTRETEHLVDEQLTHQRVEVERVAVGKIIDTMPAVREEGDTTIVPVVEEILVVERRLVLKEEVHIRRIVVKEQHRETVTLREQDAEIAREDPGQSPVVKKQ